MKAQNGEKKYARCVVYTSKCIEYSGNKTKRNEAKRNESGTQKLTKKLRSIGLDRKGTAREIKKARSETLRYKC